MDEKTDEQIWEAISRCRLTPQGMAERLRLIGLLSLDETVTDQPNKTQEHHEDLLHYYGLPRIELDRWIKLREAGLIADLSWSRGDRATGVRLKTLRLVPPMKCEPIPDDYEP